MKKLTFRLSGFVVLTAAVLFTCFVPQAHAQQFPTFAANTVTSASTVTNATTRTYDLVMDVHSQASVGVLFSTALVGAGTSSVILVVDRSLDGVIYESTGQSITSTASGTTTVTSLTKVDTNGAQFLRLHTVQNANATNATVTVQYGTKIQSP